MALANGTVVTGTTRADGTFSVPMVPLGAFTARVSGPGSTVQVGGNAALGGAVPQARVLLSLAFLVVVAAAAAAGGVGTFFLRRRMRRTKEVRTASP